LIASVSSDYVIASTKLLGGSDSLDMEDWILTYEVILDGTVLQVDIYDTPPAFDSLPRPSCSVMHVVVNEYIRGAGPDTIRIVIDAVETQDRSTLLMGDGAMHVPQPGDRGIIGIPWWRYPTAEIFHPLQILLFEDGEVPLLQKSVSDALGEIKEIVGKVDPLLAVQQARYVVRGKFGFIAPDCLRQNDSVFDCREFQIVEQLSGANLKSRALLVKTSADLRGSRMLDGGQGLLVFDGVDGDSLQLLGRPRFVPEFIPEVEGKFIIGHQIRRGIDADRVEPLVGNLEDILR
jgi:hypothetical protein